MPFILFSEFPVEIRLLIWEFSLPGPRVLGVHRREVDNFHFREIENHYNPTALSVCRESREVALKHYRLCFGTTNVYADLSGGDILYFGRSWTGGDLLGAHCNNLLKLESWNEKEDDYESFELDATVRGDVEQTTHLAMGYPT